MAARTVAAARGSPLARTFLLFSYLFSYLFFTLCLLVPHPCHGNSSHCRQSLIRIGFQAKTEITSAFAQTHNIPTEIARPPGAPWIVIGSSKRRRRRRDRKQKRGCRAGLLSRLRKQPHRPPLPSILLTNARSLANKMDELQSQTNYNPLIRECCLLIVSETWLHRLIPDATVQLASRTIHRHDRTDASGKTRGGGLCVYVLEDWCTDSRVVDTFCSPDLEAMTVRCRPFYLPRELTAVTVTAVYIPPDANVSMALGQLQLMVTKQQRAHPDGVHIIAGDFNKANLKTVLPKLHQHVKCATRGENTLDHVYTNIKHAYRASPLPHLGQSDHLSLFLLPAYTPRRRQTKPTTQTIKAWPESALAQLQDCFACTEWSIFEDQDLDTHTESVLFYIKCCVENVTEERRIRVYPNKKPWMTSEVQTLIRARNSAFRTGDRALYSTARADLRRGIKRAKASYKEKVEGHLIDSNPRQMWRGIQALTNYKGLPPPSPSSSSSCTLAEELNSFFARFETTTTHLQSLPPPGSSTPPLSLQEHEVRRNLRAVNPRKAAGPDGIPGAVIKACADQLTGILTRLFNLSLTHATVPTCLKASTIVPVPKKPAIDSLNDYRPIALTSVIMKCLERSVSQHLRDLLPPSFDPHQFAYRPNRSTEDAIALTLHTALSHLENKKSYVRMLFVDYSSAFNTIIPDILCTKLLQLQIPLPTCTWIKNFLTHRPQTVKLGPHHSSTITLSTGSPQGCVLSPLLYALYTYDCSPSHPTNRIIKYADDTTVVGLISDGDETAYREEVKKLSLWCSDNNLSLNVQKTRELIMDFRRTRPDHTPLIINGERVEIISTFKFLGTHISSDNSWSGNTTFLVKKAQQRLHFLRVLRKDNLDQKLLLAFYHSAVESVLTYCLSVWYAGSTAEDRKAVQRVINTAQRIIGCPLPALEQMASSSCLRRTRAITADPTHPAHPLFDLLRSGRRYRSIRSHTSRLTNSFFPWAIRTANAHGHTHT